MIKKDTRAWLAGIWAASGVAAFTGGVFQQDPTAIAIVFLALTYGLMEGKV